MSNWQPVSKEQHANAGWVMPNGYPQAQQDAIAPLLVDEMSHASAFYPFVFVKKADGGFRLCALLSVEQKTNLFINNQHKWMVPYTPAHYRSGPFNMLKAGERSVLAVDVDSASFHATAQAGDQPVLNDDGQIHESMKPMAEFLQQRFAQQQKTDQIVAQLEQLNLLQPWDIDHFAAVQQAGENKVAGLYRINERALHGLSGTVLSRLVKNGVMAVAYGQLLSMARMKDLETRYKMFKQQTQTAAAPMESVDLDAMFGENSDNDLFSF